MSAEPSDGEGRLPSLRDLASMADVSIATMCKAIAVLRNRGEVVTRRGHGMYAAVGAGRTALEKDTLAPRPPKRTTRKWERLSVSLEQDILTGRYPSGATMPAPKELAARYGVCYRTLRKALDGLVAGGRIVPYKRGYRVAGRTGPRTGERVVLAALGDQHGNLRNRDPRTQEHLRSLESECARAGIGLEIVTCDFPHGALKNTRTAELLRRDPKDLHTVLGFMVWDMGMTMGVLTGLLSLLLRTEKPIAILDEHGGLPMPPTSDDRVRVYSLGISPLAGHRVGRFLLDLGHRKVAFLSAVGGFNWPQNRLRGLSEAFRAAGIEDGVEEFRLEGYSRTFEFSDGAHKVTSALDSLLAAGSGPRSEEQRVLERLIATFKEQINPVFDKELMRETLGAMLERALARPELTAWVAVNDNIALECLAFLRRREVRIPEGLSVVGFDDIPAAFLSRLTSYNFDSPAVMHAMLDHILNSRLSPPHRSTKRVVEIEGFVNARTTSARPDLSRIKAVSAHS